MAATQHYPRPGDAELQTEEFQVESIVRTENKGGKILYLIKWKGYSEAENTWEPEENLMNCPELLEEYKVHGNEGMSNKRRKIRELSLDREAGPSSAFGKDKREPRKKTPKKSAPVDAQNGENEKKLSGFERGLELEKILGATEGTEGDLKGAILFLVKW